jgi:hypothetical protein
VAGGDNMAISLIQAAAGRPLSDADDND